MPSFDRNPAELRARTRRRWHAEHRWQCPYCGRRPAIQVDHFFPYWVSHDSSPRNLVPACRKCNVEKSGHMPAEWMRAVGVDPEVAKFLFAAYEQPKWRAPDTLEFPSATLDYAAGKALNDIPGQRKRPF